MSEFDVHLGQLLARLREQSGASQESLGRVMGRDQPQVSRIERGVRRVAVQDLLQWLDALGLDLSDIAGELEALHHRADSKSLWSEPASGNDEDLT